MEPITIPSKPARTSGVNQAVSPSRIPERAAYQHVVSREVVKQGAELGAEGSFSRIIGSKKSALHRTREKRLH